MQDLNSLNAFLQNLSTKASNLTPILYHTQDALYEKSMLSFDRESDANQPTKALKNQKFGKKKILTVFKESIENNRVNKVAIGSNLSYAPIVWRPGRGGKSIIPARSSSEQRGGIPKNLKRSIQRAIRKHFGF